MTRQEHLEYDTLIKTMEHRRLTDEENERLWELGALLDRETEERITRFNISQWYK